MKEIVHKEHDAQVSLFSLSEKRRNLLKGGREEKQRSLNFVFRNEENTEMRLHELAPCGGRGRQDAVSRNPSVF